MLGYKAVKAAATAKAKKRDVPERNESHYEEVEDEVPLKRNCTGTPATPRVPEADPMLSFSPFDANPVAMLTIKSTTRSTNPRKPN